MNSIAFRRKLFEDRKKIFAGTRTSVWPEIWRIPNKRKAFTGIWPINKELRVSLLFKIFHRAHLARELIGSLGPPRLAGYDVPADS